MRNWEIFGNRNGSAKVMNWNGSSARESAEPGGKHFLID